jgi:hypothetical protein
MAEDWKPKSNVLRPHTPGRRGYVAPSALMRWWAGNLKIEPAATAIRATKQNVRDVKIDRRWPSGVGAEAPFRRRHCKPRP